MSKFAPSADTRDAFHDGLELLRPAKLVLGENGHVGQALRQARESLQLELDDIAQATHVRAAYIDAIERLDLTPLPARPFAVGYVRAYARALGLDPDQVAARFRREIPIEDTTLRAPFGLQFRRRLRFGGLAGAIIALVGALAGWNLLVRVSAPTPRSTALAAPAPPRPRPLAGPARLGAPLPAPPEATTPAPYETPGLAKATAASAPAAAVTARIVDAQPAGSIPPGAAFIAHGAIYGSPHPGSGVILQALAPMSLVVRGGGGAIYFARQLGAGEAWRAPALAGLSADVDIPAAAEVYVEGRATQPLTQAQTPLAALAAPNPPMR